MRTFTAAAFAATLLMSASPAFAYKIFVSNEKGYAAAIAMVIFLLIGMVTLLQFRLQKRWVNID